MDDRPRNLKTMLSEAKDTSELMVDLAYAALYFGDPDMAEEVDELEETLSELVHEMRAVCVLAARSPRDADAMASVLQVVSAIERIGNAAVDISRIVTHRLGIPRALVADLSAAEEPAVSDLDRAIDNLVEMKNISEVAVGLAYSALVLRDQGLAAEVSHLEDRLDEMKERLELWVLRAAQERVDPAGLRGLLHLAQAAEEIGDAAQQMVWLVEEGEELHPILAIALGDADEVVVRVPIAAGSPAEGKSLRELNLETETGFYLLAIRRGGRYLYRPQRSVVLQADDELIATGPDEGHHLLAQLGGYQLIEDDETGEDELVPVGSESSED